MRVPLRKTHDLEFMDIKTLIIVGQRHFPLPCKYSIVVQIIKVVTQVTSG